MPECVARVTTRGDNASHGADIPVFRCAAYGLLAKLRSLCALCG